MLTRLPLDQFYEELILRTGYAAMLETKNTVEDRTRLENVRELLTSINGYLENAGEEPSLAGFLDEIALYTDLDNHDPDQDCVVMMTMHSAKGLEFPVVFVVGAEEGIFPGIRAIGEQDEMEEERRLAFVALTRAEKGLYLSEADGRNFDGTPRYPSRFLLDIDRNLLAFTRPPEEGLIRAARDYIGHSQTYLPETDGNMAFSVGQRVKHILFGSGTVLDVDMDKGAHVVQFDEMETPRKISFRAKLERI